MVQTAFSFRITGTDGETMRDLVYSRDRQQPTPQQVVNSKLTIDIPPGTSGSSVLPAGSAPEHPVCLATHPEPFRLQSWSDSALANYSGTALYEIAFALSSVTPRKKLFLDLGAVGVAAEVWVNGRNVGERAWSPFRFDITSAAHVGKNSLRIRVANSDAGWQSQGGTIYPKGSWGLHYQTERDRIPTIRPNGLEGPVRILSEK